MTAAFYFLRNANCVRIIKFDLFDKGKKRNIFLDVFWATIRHGEDPKRDKLEKMIFSHSSSGIVQTNLVYDALVIDSYGKSPPEELICKKSSEQL